MTTAPIDMVEGWRLLQAMHAGLKLKPYGTPDQPLSAEEEAAIRTWLAPIEEFCKSTIDEVIERCQWDADARSYFTARAKYELQEPDLDDRITCRQCQYLRVAVCSVAAPGGMVSANRGYRPKADTPKRCAGYLPRLADPDQRPGYERWLWL